MGFDDGVGGELEKCRNFLVSNGIYPEIRIVNPQDILPLERNFLPRLCIGPYNFYGSEIISERAKSTYEQIKADVPPIRMGNIDYPQVL